MAQRKTMRRRRNDPAGVRARILDRAADLFHRRGYHSTSLHELISFSEVSAGALHHHFPSKKSLILAVIAERVRPLVRELWLQPIQEAPTLGKAVSAALTAVISSIQRRGVAYGCALNNPALELSLADHELREGIAGIFAEWHAALAERIAATPGGMRLDREKRSAAANFIISVYSGAMSMAKASQSAAPLIDARGLLEAWLCEHRFAS